ncbi:MAG: VCBS repeat-containing protein [Candidatus Aminicenantes bacterium]|nr:VCBS repeat-containing protein [Candidatus Aminicenantes bacterium]
MNGHYWKWERKLLLILVGLLFFLPSVVKGSSVEQEYYSEAYGWQEGFTLIVTDCVTIDDTHAAVNYIRSMGGRVAIVSPPRVMVGWIPVELSRKLIGNQHIRSIHYDPLPEKEAASAFGEGPDLALVKFFNRVVSGEVRSEQMEAASITGTPLINDMREAPPVNWAQIEAMAASTKETPIKVPWGTGVKEVSSLVPLLAGPGNNDNMTGNCVVILWFVESDGTGSDPNTYTWTPTHVSDTLNEFFAAVLWWAGQSNAHGSPLTFWYAYFNSTDAASQTQYEPILHSSADDYKWYNELYDNVGIGASPDWWVRADAYNAFLRSVYKATWAYHTFICYNPPPAPSKFTDGYFAYCYLGRVIQELYNNDGWGPSNFDKVHAHETGHIYWAGDEYYVAGYGGCAGCGYTYSGSNGTRNGNCVKGGCGPGYDCIMNNNEWTLCSYTPRQIGWDEIYPRSLVVTAHGNGGSSVVKVWNTQNNTVLFNQAVFGAGNTNGEVMVASGDVDGDGLPELICGHGTDGSSSVRVLELDGTEIANWKAFGAANLNGQVHVAAGDVDGDGTDEIICGQGWGTSWVKVFEYDGTPIKSIKAFGAVNTNGEVNVASGDIDADGTDEIICGHGWSGKSWVKAFELNGTQIFNLKAFGAANPNGEVNLGSGNVDGDADDDIICGHHQGGSSQVKVFTLQGWLLTYFKAFGASNSAGSVYVASGNLDGDVSDEIICAHGIIAYGGSWVKVFERDGSLIWNKKVFGAANSQGEVPVSGFGGANKGLTYGYTQYIPAYGVQDEYEFWANAGAVVTIFVDRLSPNHNPEVALVDTDNSTILAQADNNVPCSITGTSACGKIISYTLPTSGVYYIWESDGLVGHYGWYKLYLTVESGFASNLTLYADNVTDKFAPPASKKKAAEK